MGKKEVFVGNQYWTLNVKLLKFTGLWPYQEKYKSYFSRSFFLTCICSIELSLIIRAYLELGKELEIVIENLAGIFLLGSAISKYVTNIVYQPKLQYLYEEINKDWDFFKEKGEHRILCNFGQYGRLVTIVYCAYFWSASLLAAAAPGVIPAVLDIAIPLNESRTKVLAYYGEYFVDQQKYYYELFLHSLVCFECISIVYTAMDSSYACCVEHVVALFGIVDYRLKEASKIAEKRIAENFKDAEKQINDYVLKAISVHHKSLHFVDLLQTTYTLCFFLTISMTLICLSLGTVVMLMNLHNLPNFTRLALIWTGTILYLFYITMPGQRIIDASLNLYDAVYSCDWYNFPVKTQELILFMLLRCSVRSQVTAGPLFVLNLENCSIVIKTAMSYCTFVATIS